jgi:hypothetical protein
MHPEILAFLRSSPAGRDLLVSLEEKKKADRRAKSARRRSRPPRAKHAPTKAERKAETKEETAAIRAYVDRRDENCVICLEPAPEPWELHHVDSGSGKSQRQTTRNCCKAHEGCHKAAHRGSLAALRALLRWAMFHGYTEAEAIINRRIAKVEEARRTPSVPVRIVVGEGR